MKKFVRPSKVSGKIKAPASKSVMQRAVAAAVLSGEKTAIVNPSLCDDARATIQVAKNLGFEINEYTEEVIVTKSESPLENVWDCGESGLCIRMFTPVAALFDKEITLTGRGSLIKRPVSMIEEPLKELGVEYKTSNGFPPIMVKGPIKGGQIHVDGSISSQFLTGLLMTLPVAKVDSNVIVMNLKSKPYIDMTLALIREFGIVIQNENYESFQIKGSQRYRTERYEVEGDWSSAAFLLVAGAIGGSVEITGLDASTEQADKVILSVLERAGAKIETTSNGIKVSKRDLKGFEFDATESPDLFPPLAVLACNSGGVSIIQGVDRLRHKESDRAQALNDCLTKLGADITLYPDIMKIRGKPLKGGVLDAQNDHRIVMAGAIAALNSQEGVIIEGCEYVSKSYPEFFEDFVIVGGEVDG